MKYLISWHAYHHDFSNGQVVEDGPTLSFHEHFYKHDEHILLSAEKEEDLRALHIRSALLKKYPDRKISIRHLDINDPINHAEIQSKTNPFLAELKDHELEIFVSPGTPAMQVVWYLAHMSLNLKTTLYQTRPTKFTLKKERPELIKINMERSAIGLTALYHQQDIIKGSNENFFITPSIENIYENARKVALTDEVSVLILGDSGTGKENLARYIHANSIRSEKPYVTINCSSFGDNLLESRLFGYKKGTFTGADKDSVGLFEEAHEGTILLDEIGDISPYMQQALLRVLQEKEIMPLGGKPKKIDVRVIAATNQNLVKRCEEGSFRWDLYYRLSVVELDIPNLLQRGKQDLRALIEFFLSQKKKQLKKQRKLNVSKEALDILLNYPYPGNVRELENIISRLYVFNEDSVSADVLPKRLRPHPTNLPLNIEFVEKEHISKVLTHFKGNKRQTAIAIGWTINTLNSKIEKYGLRTP